MRPDARGPGTLAGRVRCRQVYEAFDREHNERVALKTLREFDAIARYRFMQEFGSLSEILHDELPELLRDITTASTDL